MAPWVMTEVAAAAKIARKIEAAAVTAAVVGVAAVAAARTRSQKIGG